MFRILHLHSTYLPYRGGSAARLSQLLEAAVQLNPNVEQHVLCTRHNVPEDAPEVQTIRGVKVWRAPDFWRQAQMGRSLQRKYRYAALHAHNPRLLLMAKTIAPRRPALLEFHSPHEHGLLKRSLVHLASRLAARLVVLNETAVPVIAASLAAPQSKFAVVRNGARAALTDVPRADPPLLPRPTGDERYFGYVGTFYDWQGVGVLAEAIPHALAQDGRLRGVLVGDGPARAEVMRRLDEQGVANRVITEASVPWQKVAQYMRELDLFVMPRPPALNTEATLPLKILEAGMLQTPLLVSNRVGLLEPAMPDPDAMLWVQADLSPAALASRIVDILSPAHDQARRERASRFRARIDAEDYSWSGSAQRLLGLYMDTVGGAFEEGGSHAR